MKQGSRSGSDDSFTEFVIDQLAGLGTVEVLKLFGGRGLYWKDQIFGLIHRGRLFLRASEAGSVRLVALGSRRFEPKPGFVMKGYWEIPAPILEDADQVAAWAREGWALPRSKAKAAIRSAGAAEAKAGPRTKTAAKAKAGSASSTKLTARSRR
jgi:DNA transformation protein and related proteins